MKISDFKEQDKPREKAMRMGINALSDAELIAILMGTGQPGVNVLELAESILEECGGKLSRFSRMSIGEMCRKFKGVGPAKAVTLQAAIALGSRAKAAELKETDKLVFNSPKIVHEFLWDSMAILPHEEFHALLLTRAATLKEDFTVSRGGSAATVVDVKILMRRALDVVADSIILVHNHPSGQLRPSIQDDELTRKICQAARFFDISVRDHVIITSSGYYSYFDHGRMEP